MKKKNSVSVITLNFYFLLVLKKSCNCTEKKKKRDLFTLPITQPQQI